MTKSSVEKFMSNKDLEKKKQKKASLDTKIKNKETSKLKSSEKVAIDKHNDISTFSHVPSNRGK